MSISAEKRQMGALTFIVREQAEGNFCPQEKVVLLIKDEGKIEMASGLPQRRDPQPHHLTYGAPAGGRQDTVQGKPETREQTIGRELLEELSGYSFAAIEALTQQLTLQEVQRLAYPFVVAQWRTQKRTIDVIPVVTVVGEFDALPREVQHEIERGVDYVGEERFWAPISVLNERFQMLAMAGAQDRRINELFRPQVLTAARLYYLEYMLNIPSELIAPRVMGDNAQAYTSVKHFVDAHGDWQLNNGAMLADGSIDVDTLSQEDISYLVGKDHNS